MKQLPLHLPAWGGKRAGAGRKPNGAKAGVSHLRRERFPSRHPVHVTLRMLAGVGYLRGHRRYRSIERALRQARERLGARIVHFSVQGNHLHLLIEADGKASLTRSMQGLAIRLARALNRAAQRTGKVFSDRYHSRSLATRREVANALRYVLRNFEHHLRDDVGRRGSTLARRRSGSSSRSPRTHRWSLREPGCCATRRAEAPQKRKRPAGGCQTPLPGC